MNRSHRYCVRLVYIFLNSITFDAAFNSSPIFDLFFGKNPRLSSVALTALCREAADSISKSFDMHVLRAKYLGGGFEKANNLRTEKGFELMTKLPAMLQVSIFAGYLEKG